MNIILVGFMGCGKTTVGLEFSKTKSMVFVDADILIERKLSLPIKSIFDYYGQSFFRLVEKEVIFEISKLQNCVVSMGGGAFINKANIEALKRSGTVIFLNGSVETIMKNIYGKDRPLINGLSLHEIIDLYTTRLPFYKKANQEICIDGLTSTEIVNKIVHCLKM